MRRNRMVEITRVATLSIISVRLMKVRAPYENDEHKEKIIDLKFSNCHGCW